MDKIWAKLSEHAQDGYYYRFGIDPSYGKDKAMMCISSTDQFGKQKLEFIELQT